MDMPEFEKLVNSSNAQVIIPARLFADLLEAAGWVSTMYNTMLEIVDYNDIPDPSASSYLDSEARGIRLMAEQQIANWPSAAKKPKLPYGQRVSLADMDKYDLD